METIALGTDEDGEPLSVGILSAAAAAAPRNNLTPRHNLALAELDRAIREHGQNDKVELERWKEGLFSRGVLDKDSSNPRQAFKRLKEKLIELNEVSEWNGLVCRAGPGKVGLPPIPSMRLPPPPGATFVN